MEHRFRRQIPHNKNRNQQRETVATFTTFRSNVGSAKPRDVFSKWTTNAKPQNTNSLRLLRKHTPQTGTAPTRRDNGVQCWRGHRVTPPDLFCLELRRRLSGINPVPVRL